MVNPKDLDEGGGVEESGDEEDGTAVGVRLRLS